MTVARYLPAFCLLSACVARDVSVPDAVPSPLSPRPPEPVYAVTDIPDLIIEAQVRPGSGGTAQIHVHDGVITAITGLPANAPHAARFLQAEVVTAGFVDAHAHPYGLGRLASQLVLTDLPTYAATLSAVQGAPGSGWIQGRGWDQNDWADAPEGGWPLAEDLDRVTGERPTAVRRVDGHAVWLNSAALQASGITAATPDPAGGRILRDEAGAPSGVLIDEAMSLVAAPADTPDDVRRWLRESFTMMASAGLTGAHAMGVSDASLAEYTALAQIGQMPVRIWVYVEAESDAAARLMADGPWSVGNLSVVGVKAFADGALGSRGAWLTESYTDEPGHVGTPIHTPEQIETWAEALVSAGASMAVHAIGDRAVHETIAAFASARAAHPESAGTLRVEHAQLLTPTDRAVMATLGLFASMQPTHATSDMPWAESRVGAERIGWAYTWRSVHDAGVPLAFGSDFPVESHRPALGLWSATHRTDLSGAPEGGWTPAERVSEDIAITAFTAGSAAAVMDDTLGHIRVGAPADFTLWTPSDTEPWTPVATVVAGQVVTTATETVGSE